MAYVFPNPVDESLDLSLSEGSATNVYIVPYGDASTIATNCLDPTSPVSHPVFTGLIIKSVGFVLMQDHTATSFKNWRCTVNYGTPEEDEDGDLVSYSIDVAAESLALPKSAYEIGSIPEEMGDEHAAPHKIIPFVSYSITQHREATIDVNGDIRPLVGKVNDALFHTFAAGLVLYEGASASKSVTTDGSDDWEISHKFAVHVAGWNLHWHPQNEAWEELDFDLYEEGDFTALGL